MAQTAPRWGRFEEMRPDELEGIVAHTPVAYWPLGLLEHHGWALPVGYDGVKARAFCERLAARTGGVILPVMWWGTGGGHGEFKWTFYQDPVVGERALDTTVRQLVNFGFRAIVVLAGHYPWDGAMNKMLEPIREEHPDVLLLWGIECTIGGPDLKLPGDHAARWETAYGLELVPRFIDMNALSSGRGAESWPKSGEPPKERRHPGVVFDTADPLFAQYGEDPRKSASKDEAHEHLKKLEDALVSRVNGHLRS